jgi:hypothetical protein
MCVDNHITYVTNDVLASKYDRLYGQHATYSNWLKRVFYEDFDYLKQFLSG